MGYLADTNVVARWLLSSDPLYSLCRSAVKSLRDQGERIFVTSQNVVEYWALATRPTVNNGFGLTSVQAAARCRLLLRNFPLLEETPAIFPIWQQLVETHAIVGRQVYDARLVAIMEAHDVTHLLTLNGSHFHRFTRINVVDPHNV